MLKKLVISIMMSAILFSTCCMGVNAQENSSKEKDILNNTNVSQDGSITKGIREPEIQTRGHIYTSEAYVIKDVGAGYEVEVGALLKLDDGNGGRIVEILDDWSTASGSGEYTWSPSYVYSTKIDSHHVRLQASGYIEVAVSESLSTTVGADLLGASFSISETVGSTIYYRKRVSISEIVYEGCQN